MYKKFYGGSYTGDYMIHIYIPTYKRSHRQITLLQLPKELLEHTTLVIRLEEKDLYTKYVQEKGVQLLIVPTEYESLCKKRQYIMNTTPYKYVAMVDDDLEFKVCKEFKEEATNQDVIDLFRLMEYWLEEGIAHCGIRSLFMPFVKNNAYSEVEKLFSFLCYNTEIFREHNITFENTVILHDLSVCMQLLLKGYKNRISNIYRFNSNKRNALEGGLTEIRTKELVETAAKTFVDLYSPYAVLTECDINNSKKFTGIKCFWKEAYKHGIMERV